MNDEMLTNLLASILALLGVLVVFALATNIKNKTGIRLRSPSLLFIILATFTLVLTFFFSSKIWISMVQVSSFRENVLMILGIIIAPAVAYVLSLVVIKRTQAKKRM